MKGNLKTFLMMGKAGSGKGTQAAFLAEHLGFSIFSSGDRFRELRLRNDWLSVRIREEYDKGLLMPHWFASFVFEALLHTPPDQGLIFEGTARKKPEAEMFNEVAVWLRREYLVFDISISDGEVVRRLQKRARNDGLDNSVAKIKLRLEEHKKYTEPAIAFFSKLGKVKIINGEQAPEAVFAEIKRALI
jgi:adenylate kinase family enzyme